MNGANLLLLKQELTTDEGRRRCVYKDSRGYFTWGVGHFLGTKAPAFTCTTWDKVDATFDEDVLKAISALDTNLSWWKSLDDTRQRALANLCFNMGITDLLTKWPNTMKALKAGNYAGVASALCKSAWARQVQPERRDRIVYQMRYGKTPPPGASLCPR